MASVTVTPPSTRVITVTPTTSHVAITAQTSNVSGTTVQALINAHKSNAAPHTAYDDLPSFTLLFENGLV